MLIIADTSALIAIAACNGLHWLDTLFDEIQVPQASALRNYLFDKIIDIDLSKFIIVAQGLGKGELEAMALYKHQHADRLLLANE
ncbi:hypothetical protein [Candidatus Marithrix sp. Canyon 246]|uniref:hypothetical protein n=1 Tax=Candidatus Marithrix sp. Canyon 246 TaxID=1827136 RepID=UPI000849FD80|nr:hypothetical protein [Candidatus Marithrix sp. Canyon 246]